MQSYSPVHDALDVAPAAGVVLVATQLAQAGRGTLALPG